MTTETLSPMATLRDIVVRWSVEGPYTIADLYERLEAEHGDLLSECLRTQRAQWAKAAIRSIVEGNRTVADRVNAIMEMADPLWRGRVHPSLLQWPISDDNLWKALPSMNRADCEFVAAAYRKQAGVLLERADFFDRMAAKLKRNQTIGQVVDMDTLADLWANTERNIA